LAKEPSLEVGDEIFVVIPSPEETLHHTTQFTELAVQENLKKEAKTLAQLVLEQYLEYCHVFEEETS